MVICAPAYKLCVLVSCLALQALMALVKSVSYLRLSMCMCVCVHDHLCRLWLLYPKETAPPGTPHLCVLSGIAAVTFTTLVDSLEHYTAYAPGSQVSIQGYTCMFDMDMVNRSGERILADTGTLPSP